MRQAADNVMRQAVPQANRPAKSAANQPGPWDRLSSRFVGWLTITCTVWMSAGLALAEDPPRPEDVQAGRDALRRVRYPWYDRQDDAVQRIEVEQKVRSMAKDHRNSKWVYKPSQRNFTWPSLMLGELFSRIVYVVIWVFIALILGLLIWFLLRVYLRHETRGVTSSQLARVTDSTRGDQRVEQLPFPVDRPRGDLLNEARHHYQAGRFREATIYLFSYMLVQLDTCQIIRLSKGKTNRQYLREVKSRRRLYGILENTMIVFEDVFFGHHDLGRPEFESCWQNLDEFHELLRQGGNG